MIEELERRAQGPGGAFPVQFIKATQALSLACARAAVETGGQLDPDVESALAQLDKLPPPMPDLASFLRRLTAGDLPAIPGALPADLADFLNQLLQALREAPNPP